MGFRRRDSLIGALALVVSGAVAGAAASHGLWLAFAAAMLVVAWLVALALVRAQRMTMASPVAPLAADRRAILHAVLLDASPTPLLSVEDGRARALNRAARRLFGTDDRILAPPSRLLDRGASHLSHAGRSWRADRIDVEAYHVVALIDVDAEERTAEARASAEMIQVLGHELLNGLVPIVSLAECGITAMQGVNEPNGRALLLEILNTLARQAEGLQRFTEAYRSLARLPAPLRAPVRVAALFDDLARLFAVRWPDAKLVVHVADDLSGMFDRDQLSQAIWALLQNAVEAAGGDADPALVRLSAVDGGAKIVVDVTDSGVGVAADQITAIFRPFVTGKSKGTGIGLSLARQIAQAHGGRLWLASQRPTCFRLELP